MTSTPAPFSPFQIREFVENLRRFDSASANRQIDLHIANGTMSVADGNKIRAGVANLRHWMF